MVLELAQLLARSPGSFSRPEAPSGARATVALRSLRVENNVRSLCGAWAQHRPTGGVAQFNA